MRAAPSGKARRRRAPAATILALAVPALAVLAACAPRLAAPGPGLAELGLAEPRFTDERFVTADGLALPARAWLPAAETPRAVILALHGFNDYSRAFETAGAFWAERGIATYAYDQRGFGAAPEPGLWAGTEVLVGDLRLAARLLRARHPDVPLYLLGDSMGGAVILAAGDTAPLPAEGLILVAPAVWGRQTMPLAYRAALWLAAHTVPWAKVSGRGLDIQASDNLEMLRALGRDPLVIKETRIDAVYGLVELMDRALAAAPEVGQAALLLYGTKDEVVPEDPVLQLWRALPAGAATVQRRALYANGWHMLLRDLGAEVVLADIAHWIERPATALPSGAEDRARARLNGGT